MYFNFLINQIIINYFLIIITNLVTFNDALKIVHNPVDQYTKLNENILFKCLVDDYQNDKDIVEWCKNDFCTWGRSIELDDGRLKFKSLSKHFIVGDRSNGEWNLLIENVTSNDIGQYKCTVTRRSEQLVYKINSNTANLTIMEKPRSVELNLKNSFDITLNKKEEIICSVEKGIPEPRINWILIDSLILNNLTKIENILNKKDTLRIVDSQKHSNYEINSTLISNSTTYFYSNQLKLNGTMSLLNKTLICLVEHPLLDEPILKTIKVDLKYKPILTINHEPTTDHLEENKTYTFKCKSNSNPESNISSFYIIDPKYPDKWNNIEFSNESLTLKLNRSMNGSLLSCKHTNQIGHTVLNYTLNIKFAPKFIETPDSIIVVNNSIKNISLSCKVDSNPKSVIFWIKNQNEIIHIGEKLNLQKSLDSNMDGEYACQARSAGFRPIAYKISVVTQGVPTIFGDSFYFIDKDKDINIQFSTLSSPAYQFGPICTKLNENNSLSLEIILPIRNQEKYSLEVDDVNQLKMSSKFNLLIRKPSDLDIGFYNCTITNKYGSSIYNFEIRKKSDGNNLWIVLSLSIFFFILIVILILSILILICIQRKRTKDKQRKIALPNVSDHSGYDDSKNQFNIFATETISNDLEIKQRIFLSACHKQLSDDRKIDDSFKKQSNQISLILDQNATEISNQNLSYECLKFPPDTQNLILTDNLKSICSTQNIYSSSQSNYQKANIFSSKFQTNV